MLSGRGPTGVRWLAAAQLHALENQARPHCDLADYSQIRTCGGRALVIGNFLSGIADTGTVLKMSVVTLAVYLPLGPVLATLWGPYGLLIAYILSNATSTVYGLRQTSVKHDARPDGCGSTARPERGHAFNRRL